MLINFFFILSNFTCTGVDGGPKEDTGTNGAERPAGPGEPEIVCDHAVGLKRHCNLLFLVLSVATSVSQTWPWN